MSNDESDEKIPAKVEEFELFLCLKGLSAGDSVLKVKQKIASLLPDTPIEHQRVIYNGRILDDDQVLSHYSIAHQSTLFLVVSKTSKKGSENSNAAAAAAVSRSTATGTSVCSTSTHSANCTSIFFLGTLICSESSSATADDAATGRLSFIHDDASPCFSTTAVEFSLYAAVVG